MGGDRCPPKGRRYYCVSIHAPTWGATTFVRFSCSRLWRFNPRPHMGGDLPGLRDDIKTIVSIHAPTWGATCSSSVINSCNSCFNPRPHMGGDSLFHSQTPTTICFNPRPHMGGDDGVKKHFKTTQSFNPRPHMGGDAGASKSQRAWMVSIHAPTWGATANSLRNH